MRYCSAGKGKGSRRAQTLPPAASQNLGPNLLQTCDTLLFAFLSPFPRRGRKGESATTAAKPPPIKLSGRFYPPLKHGVKPSRNNELMERSDHCQATDEPRAMTGKDAGRGPCPSPSAPGGKARGRQASPQGRAFGERAKHPAAGIGGVPESHRETPRPGAGEGKSTPSRNLTL